MAEGRERVPTRHSAMLIELRSTGCQTIAPPSLHPSGEVVRWETDGVPWTVGGSQLRRAVARAGTFLTDILAGGPQPERLIQERAKVWGISERSLRRSKRKLRIPSIKVGYEEGWSWTLPDDETLEWVDEETVTPKVANIHEDGHLRCDRGLLAASAR